MIRRRTKQKQAAMNQMLTMHHGLEKSGITEQKRPIIVDLQTTTKDTL